MPDACQRARSASRGPWDSCVVVQVLYGIMFSVQQCGQCHQKPAGTQPRDIGYHRLLEADHALSQPIVYLQRSRNLAGPASCAW